MEKFVTVKVGSIVPTLKDGVLYYPKCTKKEYVDLYTIFYLNNDTKVIIPTMRLLTEDIIEDNGILYFASKEGAKDYIINLINK